MNQIENESRQWGDRHLKQEMCARWELPTSSRYPGSSTDTTVPSKAARVGGAALLSQPTAEHCLFLVGGGAWGAVCWGLGTCLLRNGGQAVDVDPREAEKS